MPVFTGQSGQTGGKDLIFVGQSILERLVELKYDFLKPSKFNAAPGITDVNTIQMMMMSEVSVFLLPIVLVDIYTNHPEKG